MGPPPQWKRWSPSTGCDPILKAASPGTSSHRARKGSGEASLENPELNQVRPTSLLDAGILSVLTVYGAFLREVKRQSSPREPNHKTVGPGVWVSKEYVWESLISM